jgi:hypothetical protein
VLLICTQSSPRNIGDTFLLARQQHTGMGAARAKSADRQWLDLIPTRFEFRVCEHCSGLVDAHSIDVQAQLDTIQSSFALRYQLSRIITNRNARASCIVPVSSSCTAGRRDASMCHHRPPMDVMMLALQRRPHHAAPPCADQFCCRPRPKIHNALLLLCPLLPNCRSAIPRIRIA